MAITSQITARPVLGSHPAGFTPLVPKNSGNSEYIASVNYNREYDYSGVTFTSGDTAQTQADFLLMVKADLDTNVTPTVFTDSTIDYDVEYVINTVRLDFETLTSDRSIWSERFYKYFVGVSIKANVDV